jgi:hypothetical protein
MAIIVNCPCGRKLKIQDEYAGQEGTCPACQRVLQIPRNEDVLEIVEDDIPSVVPVEKPAAEASDELNNHGGAAIPADADFFVDPPTEIGPLFSAHTTLTQSKRPWSIWQRLLLALVCCGVGFVIGCAIDLIFGLQIGFWFIAWPFGGAILAALIAFTATKFSHTCTYIGRDGAAHFMCSGQREAISKNEVFRFRDASELRTAQTRHYKNGVYQRTEYSYTWTDVGGRQRFQIKGSHTSEKGEPPAKDHYQFARATEFAWTMYLLDQVHRQIELGDGVKFQLGSNNWIRIGPGKLTFSLSGDVQEWAAEEMNGVIVQNGVVKIKRTDAKEGWFSSTGVIKFSFDTLSNAQLFFHLMDKVLGVQTN